MIIRLASLVILTGVATHSFADHWNTRNLLDACDDDNAFASPCYTYLGAFKDILGYMYICHGFYRAEDVKTAKTVTVFATPKRSESKN